MNTLSFEEAYAQLEAAVAALQNGQLTLERALHYYEEGTKLARYCDELLQKAELRVQQLSVDSQGNPIVESVEIV